MATTSPTSGSSPAALPVSWQLRRPHDGSVISSHCSLACGQQTLSTLSLAQMMGEYPPAPKEPVEAWLVEVSTGHVAAYTWGQVPSDGQPPAQAPAWW